ncbi:MULTISPECIES: DUF2309 domain-containing protein [Salinibaculum]|uniref:DUF2309 domain-containing protein n=1 Tax=Salinibaculum TaxID=2732368 RepID=UPI0030CB92A2
MTTETDIRDSIETAATTVGSVWPLHSFVTANPLAGFEDRPFHEAVQQGEAVFDGDGYPSADVFRRAWERGQIDTGLLRSELAVHGYDADPTALLERMETKSSSPAPSETTVQDRLDRILTKWLAAFLDEGQAEWPMPNREEGFYAAFRAVARYDDDIPDRKTLADLPADPVAAIRQVVDGCPPDRLPEVFEFHLTALPGWTGFIKQRVADGGAWQSACPITLADYLAVRLTLADLLDASIAPSDAPEKARGDHVGPASGDIPLPEVWLSAWEATYREELVDTLADASATASGGDEGGRPDAQLVFCIDTRSEVLRRHVEATGDYETHGYAGFFGIPMRYEGYDADVTVDACPPILDAQHRIADRPTGDAHDKREAHNRWHRTVDAADSVVDVLKSNAATAFNFVESAGAGYGAALAARTLLPARVYDAVHATDRAPEAHEFCEPTVDYNPDAVTSLREGLVLEEKVEYAATAFDLMGWEEFARVVVFTGHASETANNPFASSLDCGACAGNPGGPNARVLAALCNDEAVRDELRDRGFDIPEDTVFLAGEHNTTTDEVTLYDGDVPESHEDEVEQLRADLASARAGAAAERAETMDAGAATARRETERRAADWAETRPEWGLAGNASFVIGPRELTQDVDLDGRAFLHSYDHATDPDGDALSAIMAGPMVVTQWINTQYYFATVDNGVYGSGSKITHNPVGNLGVYQGNGGDLATGLPLQSVMAADGVPYHQPLRLSTVIHAPVDRVTEILADHEDLAGLLDNGWLSLTVVDPEQDHRAFHYDGDLAWTAVSDEQTATAGRANPPLAADD